MVFDSNPQMAITTRYDFFQHAVKTHIILAGAHLAEIVRLEKDGDSFVAQSVDYQ